MAAAALLRSARRRAAALLGAAARLDARAPLSSSPAAAATAAAAAAAAPPARDPRFAALRAADLDAFRAIVGAAGVVTDPHALAAFNADWTGRFAGAAAVALRPRCAAEVAALVAHCAGRRLALVPQGGNTGLVGGSVPVFDEVILSLGAMNRIISFDEVTGVLTAEAGCVLETLDNFVAARGHAMPVDLGARGSAQLGGLLATNAGGVRLLRHGPLAASVLGVSAVLASGAPLDLLSPLRKDNTGYSLKNLLIGSEGTLGVLTAAAVLCPPRPPAPQTAWLAAPSFEAAQRALAAARRYLGEALAAFEFLDAEAVAIAAAHLPGARDPLPGAAAPYALLVEAAGADPAHDAAKMERYLEAVLESGDAADGVLAQGGAQAGALWALREGVTEALRARGGVHK
jgi:D-2-hydroxyglutarate dehydrogenase